MDKLRIGYILDLSSQDKKIEERELEGDDKQTAARIMGLREALQQRKHFVTRQDDSFLLMFLRRAQFSQTQALELIENFTRNRVTDPYRKVYTNAATLDPCITEIQCSGAYFLLPGVSSTGTRVAVMRFGVVDYSKYTVMDVLRASVLDLDIIVKDPIVQITLSLGFTPPHAAIVPPSIPVRFVSEPSTLLAEKGKPGIQSDLQSFVRGLHAVIDYSNIGLRILRHMTLETIRVAAETLVNTCPWRVNGLHLVNMPRIINAAVSLFKPFLSKEMANIVHVHSSPTHLHSFINPEVLPEEFGGTAGTTEELVKKFHQHVLANLGELDLYSCLRHD